MPEESLPFRPSVFDRVFHWMERKPARKWWYLVLYVVGALTTIVAFGIDKGWDASGVVLPGIVDGHWTYLGYAAIHAIDNETIRATKRFRSVYAGTDAEYKAEVYRLSTMPSRTAGVLWVASFAVFGGMALLVPEFADIESATARAIQAPIVGFSYATAPLLVFHTVRLLIGISRMLRAGTVNIFHLNPLYGFSLVTAKVGFVWLIILMLNFVSEWARRAGDWLTAEVQIGTVVATLLALIAFIAPLRGTRNRIAAAKADALAENSGHIERVRTSMYRELEAGNTGAFKGLDDSLGGLLRMGTTIASISPWPWSRGTLRGFFTAIGTPLLIFVLQRVIDAFV